MTGLLTDSIRAAVTRGAVIEHSDPLGVILLAVLLVLLLERQILRVLGASKDRPLVDHTTVETLLVVFVVVALTRLVGLLA